jgi:ABC-type transport system involved in multi-copper enzyme maturation permease subunit
MTTTIIPDRSYQSDQPTGRDGFAQLVHSEWTKFRTVRGWVIAAVTTALIIVILAVVSAAGSHTGTCINGTCTGSPPLRVGPGGEAVNDKFYFVHRTLGTDGAITARTTSMTGLYPSSGGAAAGVAANGQAALAGMRPGLQPWTKVGVIIKANTTAGSAYAAVMITGGHGVRMQYNYTNDIASPSIIGTTVSTSAPQWLRLARTGDSITGSESPDGIRWATVGTIHLAGLGSDAQAGLFAASPDYTTTSTHLGGSSSGGGPTLVTASFDNISLQSGTPGASWAGIQVGGSGPGELPGVGFDQTNTATGAWFTVTGTGDIAPDVGTGTPIEQTLVGAFAALIIVIVLATLFITGEYRRGLIRTSLAATPRRGRVLAAKAVVLAAVTFIAGLIASAIAVPIGEHLLRSNGNAIYPVSTLTELRLIVGTAALLAVVAVLALAVAALLRRAAGAVTLVAAGVVLPYLLAVAFVLPAAPAEWLLRLTPAAGFAIQQSLTRYAQVNASYGPANGYYPLAPWVGFAVLCAWTALTLGLAVVVIRRRDA